MVAVSNGRSVRLFLVDGTPTGLITAEIMNWTGHALIAPRSRIGEALRREESSRTGVYFLVGDDPDQPSQQRVYIGEGDNVATRVSNHNKDESKEFWTRFCLVTSKDMNLTKAHVRYLESRFIEVGKDAGRAILANGTEPIPRGLPEADVADMEYFIDQVKVILPVVGMDFLRARPSPSRPSDPKIADDAEVHTLDLVFRDNRHGMTAEAVERDGEITVLAGSTAYAGPGNIEGDGYGAIRARLVREGTLVPADDATFLRFTDDTTFASPSAAAAVIYNQRRNGRHAWLLKLTKQSLKEWQDAQVADSSAVVEE